MKTFIIPSFIGWILKKIANSVIGTNSTFRSVLREEPWLALVMWLCCSMMLFLVYIFVMMLFIDTNDDALMFILIYLAGAFLYLAVNGVSVMYEAFKEERQELFNVLRKN